jgi:uncharacterized protein (DUF1684 family)
MKPYLVLLCCLCLISCNTSNHNPELNKSYLSKIEQRQADLAENRVHYLQLVGLFKAEAANTFGKDSLNDFVLDIEKLPPIIGTILLPDSVQVFSSFEGVLVRDEHDSTVANTILKFDEYGSSQRLFHKDLSWQVITRSNQYYVRFWHSKNPAVNAFKGFERFEIDPDLNFKGYFSYYENAKSQMVKSEVDGQRSTRFIGFVTFEYGSETHDLDVGVNGFTMVSDETTGEETYGGGRYLYLDLPQDDGPVTLDFNFLYNPPCSFSKFTTCLYPPRQNHLPFKVLAGEQKFLISTESNIQ